MKTTVWEIDAFRDESFLGNPAGVCLLPSAQPDAWMQAVARRMNLSETAFLTPLPTGEFHLRWFTPAAEVRLCGHATLASAHFLWGQNVLEPFFPARFHTLSGLLVASRNQDLITLNFPAKPAVAADAPAGFLEALGVQAVSVARSEFDYLVRVESAKALREIRPDFARLFKVPVRGIIVTAQSDDVHFDFMSRFFAPTIGVNEDPVTGSAHCTLAPYWASQLGKRNFVACQVSARGGVLHLALKDDRVELGGKAVVTGHREFELN